MALEKVLAFKDVRVSQVGMKPEDLERVEKGRYFRTFISYVQCMLYVSQKVATFLFFE